MLYPGSIPGYGYLRWWHLRWSCPRGVTQRVLDAVHGNGLEMALAWPVLDSPDGAGKQGLGKRFYHLHSSQGPAARLLKGQGIRDGCLRSIICISHSLLWKNVLVHPFHFTPGYSLASLKLAVTSS